MAGDGSNRQADGGEAGHSDLADDRGLTPQVAEPRFDSQLTTVEREAIEALAETARQQVKRLPPDSPWRNAFIEVSDLASAFRLQELQVPRAPAVR